MRWRAVDFLRYLLRSIRIEFRRSENLDALVQRKRGLIEEFLANALIPDAVQKSVRDGFVLPLTEFADACELCNRDYVIVERLAGFLIVTIELVALELGVDFWFAVFSELRENRIYCDVSFRDASSASAGGVNVNISYRSRAESPMTLRSAAT